MWFKFVILFLILTVLTVVSVIFSSAVKKQQTEEYQSKKTEIKNNSSNAITLKKLDKCTSSSTQDGVATSSDEVNTNGWQMYKNKECSFEMEYPKDWVLYTYIANSYRAIVFGSKDKLKADGWGINVYRKDGADLEILISVQGSQFNDRRETRKYVMINGKKWLLITVTTENHPNWISKSLWFVTNDYIYQLGNGAVVDEGFARFVNSFHFIN